jgi:hypothetical protein
MDHIFAKREILSRPARFSNGLLADGSSWGPSGLGGCTSRTGRHISPGRARGPWTRCRYLPRPFTPRLPRCFAGRLPPSGLRIGFRRRGKSARSVWSERPGGGRRDMSGPELARLCRLGACLSLQKGGHFRPSALAPPFAKSAHADASTVVRATCDLNVFANGRGRFAKSRGSQRAPVHAVVRLQSDAHAIPS